MIWRGPQPCPLQANGRMAARSIFSVARPDPSTVPESDGASAARSATKALAPLTPIFTHRMDGPIPEPIERVGHFQPSAFGPTLEPGHLRHHVLQVHLLGTLSPEDRHEGVVGVGHIELDVGVVYETDAASRPADIIVIAPLDGADIRYPIAPLTDAPHAEKAADFVEFVLSAEGRAILDAAGFGNP